MSVFFYITPDPSIPVQVHGEFQQKMVDTKILKPFTNFRFKDGFKLNNQVYCALYPCLENRSDGKNDYPDPQDRKKAVICLASCTKEDITFDPPVLMDGLVGGVLLTSLFRRSFSKNECVFVSVPFDMDIPEQHKSKITSTKNDEVENGLKALAKWLRMNAMVEVSQPIGTAICLRLYLGEKKVCEQHYLKPESKQMRKLSFLFKKH